MPKATEKKCTRSSCAKAGVMQPAEAFREDLGNFSHLSSWCRECTKAQARERRARRKTERERQANGEPAPPPVKEPDPTVTKAVTSGAAPSLREPWGGKCLFCGKDGGQWTPVSGRQAVGNSTDDLQLLCWTCERKLGKFRVDFRVSPPCIVGTPFGYMVMKHDLQK